MPAVQRFRRKFGFTPTSVTVQNENGTVALLYDETGTNSGASPVIDADGVTFYAVPGRYRLLLNKGSGEAVRHSTVLDATGGGGPVAGTTGGGPVAVTPTRTTASLTTDSLAPNTRSSGTIGLASGYRVYKIATTRPARVRLYASAAQRDADATRSVGVDPTGNHGLLLEVVTTSTMLELVLSPVIDGFVDSGTAAPITVTNLDSATGSVGVTLTYVRTE